MSLESLISKHSYDALEKEILKMKKELKKKGEEMKILREKIENFQEAGKEI